MRKEAANYLFRSGRVVQLEFDENLGTKNKRSRDLIVTSRSLVFHPISVLVFSLSGALLYAAWISWRFAGGDLSSQYLYVVPIVVPFVAFLFDRVRRIWEPNFVVLLIDALVVGIALMRMMGKVPYVSGHALFLVYALLRPGSKVTRITAGLVMLEVIYLKFFVWHDLITPVTGAVLAIFAALLTRRFETVGRHSDSQVDRRLASSSAGNA